MKKNQKLSWNDFLFENRNKSFGAYQIRKNENWNLLKSLVFTLAFLGILGLIVSFTTVEKPVEKPEEPKEITHELTKISEKQKVEKPKVLVTETVVILKTKKKENKKFPDPKADPKIENPIDKNVDLPSVPVKDNSGTVEGSTGPKGDVVSSGSQTVSGSSPAPVITPKITKTSYNVREVSKMAVFPGCENVGNSKLALQNCMSQKLQSELGSELSDFSDLAAKYGINLAQTKLHFTVNKSGQITHVKTMNGNNKDFDAEAQKAMERISRKLIQRGKYIKPAELNDGSEVDIVFSIPVQFLMN